MSFYARRQLLCPRRSTNRDRVSLVNSLFPSFPSVPRRDQKIRIRYSPVLTDPPGMKLLNVPLGLLFNFHQFKLVDGISRLIRRGANNS
jgi:hypothetical protein